MESLLEKIRPTVQKTADVIADVIGLEVEVADNNFIRIAGTGQYRVKCGELMNAGFVYRHVMEVRQLIMIEHPGFHVLCRPCPHYQNCPEHTELAAPIIVHDSVVGVIGLVSFDERQTEHFMKHKEWMVQFIIKMAELIASNLLDVEDKPQIAEQLNLSVLEKQAIQRALLLVSQEVKKADKAAQLLGISRATLYRKLREYKLEII